MLTLSSTYDFFTMKNILLVVLFLCSPILLAQSITIDEAKASITFNFEDDDVEGTLSGFEFFGSVDLNNLEGSSFSGSVATETIDTHNWLRNRHLRRKYFNAKDFPKLTFNSTRVSGTANNFTVIGALSIKGTKKEVSWNFRQKENMLVGTTTINTQDFDIAIHKKYEENNATIQITLPFQ